MGYDDSDSLASDLGKSDSGLASSYVPCMSHLGLDCPKCALNQAIFKAAYRYDAGTSQRKDLLKESNKYWKKPNFYLMGLVENKETRKVELKLVHIMQTQAELIAQHVSSKNPDERWEHAFTDPEKGFFISLSKVHNKTTGYNNYGIATKCDPYPVTQDQLQKFRDFYDIPSFFSSSGSNFVTHEEFKDFILFMKKMEDQKKVFSVVTHMPKPTPEQGYATRVRFLPNFKGRNLAPIFTLSRHYNEFPSAWDNKWLEVKYDTERYQEVITNPEVAAELRMYAKLTAQVRAGNYKGLSSPQEEDMYGAHADPLAAHLDAAPPYDLDDIPMMPDLDDA